VLQVCNESLAPGFAQALQVDPSVLGTFRGSNEVEQVAFFEQDDRVEGSCAAKAARL